MAAAALSKHLVRRRPPPLLPSFSSSSAAAIPARFSSSALSGDESNADDSVPYSDTTAKSSAAADNETPQQRRPFIRPLENGLDTGVYKAILVGKVGQQPVQKQLRSGRAVVLFSLGTGGIRNNRRPLDNEEPKDYAERCAVQWHRVSVYPPRLGSLALKHVKPGSILYMEGNLETKVFSDPMTGLVRRIREIAIRRDGRLVFLGDGIETEKSELGDLRRAGYY